VATVSLAVDLPQGIRGTHMSRFVEVLKLSRSGVGCPHHPGDPLELLARLNASRSHIEFTFPYFMRKTAPVSGLPGLIDYEVSFELEADGVHDIDFVLTVKVPVTTLCPCSKAISDRGAHNQRGIVTYAVRFRKPIWIEDLIRLVERCASAELYSACKRPNEEAITSWPTTNPVFVEDLVRNVAARSDQQANIVWYRVEAENFESIHNHNAYARIEKRIG